MRFGDDSRKLCEKIKNGVNNDYYFFNFAYSLLFYHKIEERKL